MMRLSQVLAVPKGITAAVGGGGKSSLLWRLGEELSAHARVILTTTTHIWPPACETLLSPSPEAIVAAFEHTGLMAVGSITPEGKLTKPPISMAQLSRLADYVLVEADGSRGLPLKVPNAHEPVIPVGTALTVALAGMSCAGLTILEAAHRPELYAAIAGFPLQNRVTPKMVASVLMHPAGQRKGLDGRFAVVLNQADTPQRLDFAHAIAQALSGITCITALQTMPDFLDYWRDGRQINAQATVDADTGSEAEGQSAGSNTLKEV